MVHKKIEYDRKGRIAAMSYENKSLRKNGCTAHQTSQDIAILNFKNILEKFEIKCKIEIYRQKP